MGRENRRTAGSRGESLAAGWLRARGFRIIESNYRCRLGEIDLIAEDGGTVVFVEVKSKRGGRFGAPEEMVTHGKQARLTMLALVYLRHRGWMSRPARFDVVAVDWIGEGKGRLRHYRNAFAAGRGW